jgi:hypothetical protein
VSYPTFFSGSPSISITHFYLNTISIPFGKCAKRVQHGLSAKPMYLFVLTQKDTKKVKAPRATPVKAEFKINLVSF